MIVKKPYAFLIKHFKIIHLVLFFLLLYIVYKTTGIVSFFNDYVNNGFYTYQENLVSEHINIFMFFITILIITIGIIIYWLMKWKDKPRKYYIITCVFYLILLISFLVYYNAFSIIQNEVLDIRTIRAYRDISIIIIIPQYILLAIALIRGAGFNIKQFNFSKDLMELDITEKDAEEIELTLSNDTYKYKRKLKRWLREFRYYLVENKFLFIIISSLAIVVIGIVIYFNINVYNKTYDEGTNFNIDGIVFNVTKSYLSDVDYNGNIIIKDKFYIIVSLEMKNNSDTKKTLDLTKVKLQVKEKSFYPTLSKNNHFIDYGEGYSNNVLYPGETYNYLLIFELDNSYINENFVFRLVDDINYVRGEINARYKDVKLDIIYDDELIINEKTNVEQIINFPRLSSANLVVLSSEINDSFEENYSYCVNECYNATHIVKANIVNTSLKTVLKVVMDYTANNEYYYSKYINTNEDFIKYFGSVYYEIGESKKNVKASVITTKNKNGRNVYIEVPSEIKNASVIELYLTVRNIRYIVKLK